MIESQSFAELKRPLLFLPRVLWIANLATALGLGALPFFIDLPGQLKIPELEGQPDWVLYSFAAPFVVLIFLIRHFQLGDPAIRRILHKPFEANLLIKDSTGAIDKEKEAKVNSLNVDEQRSLQVFASFFLPILLCCVLAETIAVFGLLGSMLREDPTFGLPLVILSVALLFLCYPNFQNIPERVRQQRGSSGAAY